MNLENGSNKIQWLALPAVERRLRMRRETIIAYIGSGPLKARLCAGRWFLTATSVDRFHRWLERERNAA
jgi:hypothetical protein